MTVALISECRAIRVWQLAIHVYRLVHSHELRYDIVLTDRYSDQMIPQ